MRYASADGLFGGGCRLNTTVFCGHGNDRRPPHRSVLILRPSARPGRDGRLRIAGARVQPGARQRAVRGLREGEEEGMINLAQFSSAYLMSRISGRYQASASTGCWVWSGAVNNRKYGCFVIQRGRLRSVVLAHRASYEAHIGPIPMGQFVCHACDNSLCINPAHLFCGTPAENTSDMISKGRHKLCPPPPMRGEKNPRAKLSVEQVAAIRSSREPAKLLASLYGVHWTTIFAIRRGALWKDTTRSIS